ELEPVSAHGLNQARGELAASQPREAVRMPVAQVYAALMVVSSLFSVCGNVVLLLVVLLNKELRTETWALTLSFCLSDLALGLSIIPFGVHNSLFRTQGYPSDGPLCQGSAFLYLLLQLASIHSLTWATIDKFTEICFALSYSTICTSRRTRVVLVLVWLYGLINAALPLLGFGHYSYSSTRFLCAPSFQPDYRGFSLLFIVVGIIAPILIMCSMYAYIVYIVRKQVRRGTFTFSGHDPPAAASAVATWLILLTSALNPWINSMTQT
uniref:G-protein coupled receptors family 1 profile domain-containing protein n=1 Tax=Oncorhynchus tshawytscha TaxID=74940 RepID=A0AAZ3R2P1_ONCTS